MVRDHSIFVVHVALAYDEIIRDEFGDTKRTGKRIEREQVYRVVAREQAYAEAWIANQIRIAPDVVFTVTKIDRERIDAAIISMQY